jgi:hypothetical protein
VASLLPTYPSFTLRLLHILVPPRGVLSVLLHLAMRTSIVSNMPAVSPPPFHLSVESYGRLDVSAMQYLNALAEALLASSAPGTDVTKAAFTSGIRELGATLCVGHELVYREGVHVYAAAGGNRARMCLHIPTDDVTYVLVLSGLLDLMRIRHAHAYTSASV